MKLHNIAARVAKFLNIPAAANDPMFEDTLEVRRANLRKRQEDMYNQMMADGTHMYARKGYERGGSRILREAGLVK